VNSRPTLRFDFTPIVRYEEHGAKRVPVTCSVKELPLPVSKALANLTATWKLLGHSDIVTYGNDWVKFFTDGKHAAKRKPMCAGQRLKANGTIWRDGLAGVYACADCARLRRPCLMVEGGKFWLLPLDEIDADREFLEGEIVAGRWIMDS
jgi:hypothetical protein